MDEKRMGQSSPNDGPMGSISPKPPQPVVYTEVREDDVLLGRGKKFYNNRGNVRFRKLVLDRACAYKQKNIAYRRALARDIISVVARNGGKFLRSIEPSSSDLGESPSQKWQDVPPAMVVTKVKQALRDLSARIPDDQQPRPLATTDKQSTFPPTPKSLLLSMPRTGKSSRPSSFASSVLPSSQPQLSGDDGLFQPLLPPQLIAQDSEHSRLLAQIASLEHDIQQRQQRERMLQLMDQQTKLRCVLDQSAARLPGGDLTLLQRALCLHRLNWYNNTPMQQDPSPRLTVQHQQDCLIDHPLPYHQQQHNLSNMLSLDPRIATMPPHHRRGDMTISPLRAAVTGIPSYLPPAQLGTALPTLPHHTLLGGRNISVSNLMTEQGGSLDSSYLPTSAMNVPQGSNNDTDLHNIMARGSSSLFPTPITPTTFQNRLLGPADDDVAQLPLLDVSAESGVPATPQANGLQRRHHEDDNSFSDLFFRDNSNDHIVDNNNKSPFRVAGNDNVQGQMDRFLD